MHNFFGDLIENGFDISDELRHRALTFTFALLLGVGFLLSAEAALTTQEEKNLQTSLTLLVVAVVFGISGFLDS
jgi:hypothetical protein